MEIFYIFDFVFFMIFVCVCVWGGNSYFFFILGNEKPQLFGKRAIIKQNWVKLRLASSIRKTFTGTFDLVALKVILGSFGALVIFGKYDDQNAASTNCSWIFIRRRPMHLHLFEINEYLRKIYVSLGVVVKLSTKLLGYL